MENTINYKITYINAEFIKTFSLQNPLDASVYVAGFSFWIFKISRPSIGFKGLGIFAFYVCNTLCFWRWISNVRDYRS